MILSDQEITERIVKKDQVFVFLTRWKQNDWNQIGENILIDPYDEGRLEVCTYNLSIGSEYVSLRDPREPQSLGEHEAIVVGPGETVLILTEEYLCLPRTIMALVVPRARLIFEGTSISATRVDPTWHGKLVVGFTNHTINAVRLLRGSEFCACIFLRTGEVQKTMSALRVQHLGRTSLVGMSFEHAFLQPLLSPDQVTMEALSEVVSQYGKPWDIVRGAIERSKTEIIEYVDRDLGPNIAREAGHLATQEAFKSQQRMLWALVLAMITAILGVAVAGVWYLVQKALS